MVDPDSRGKLMDARQLAVLEKFMGMGFMGTNGANPNANAAPLLQKAYYKLVDRLYAAMASATYLKDIISRVNYKIGESGAVIEFADVINDIDKAIDNDSVSGKQLLADFLRVVYGSGLSNDTNLLHFCNHFAAKSPELARIVYSANRDAIIGSDKSDSLYGTAADDFVYGDAGDDHLNGNAGNDTLYGGEGKDSFDGGQGDDTLIGGQGTDRLDGGPGNDTYIFNKGDGEDYIMDIDGEADKVRLEYEPISVVFERVNNDLRLRMPDSLDAITVSSWYSSDNYKIETFKSANGSVITHTQVDSLIQAMSSFQKDTGMTWEQAVINQPTQVQSIIQQYWTAPTT